MSSSNGTKETCHPEFLAPSVLGTPPTSPLRRQSPGSAASWSSRSSVRVSVPEFSTFATDRPVGLHHRSDSAWEMRRMRYGRMIYPLGAVNRWGLRRRSVRARGECLPRAVCGRRAHPKIWGCGEAEQWYQGDAPPGVSRSHIVGHTPDMHASPPLTGFGRVFDFPQLGACVGTAISDVPHRPTGAVPPAQ